MRRRLPAVTAVVALVSVTAGVVLVLTADVRADGAVGWFAYGDAAVEQAMQRADSRFWIEAEDSALVGAALVVVGLLALAALAGWLVGRRRAAHPRTAVHG